MPPQTTLLPDILLIGDSREVLQHRDLVLKLLKERGWVINLEKSDLEPTKTIQFLGLIWDSQLMTVRLSENNKEKLLKKTEKLVMNKVTNRKTMQSWIGTINHATIVLPNL